MRGFLFSPAAQGDLSSIWDYTEDRWGQRQAEKYLTQIKLASQRIAADPEIGQACDQIRPGYRRYGVGSHVIFYRTSATDVLIIRVLHLRMDPRLHI